MTAPLQAGTIKVLKWFVPLIHASNPPPVRVVSASTARISAQPLAPPPEEPQPDWVPDARTMAARLRPAAWVLATAFPCFPRLALPWGDLLRAPRVLLPHAAHHPVRAMLTTMAL